MVRMCAQSKSPKSAAWMCVWRPQFTASLQHVTPSVCDLSASPSRLFASLTGNTRCCSCRAQCGWRKQTLINFYYTLNLPGVRFTVQSHPFSSQCMCKHQHPECTGSYATRWLDMSESRTSVCAVRTRAGPGQEGVDGDGGRASQGTQTDGRKFRVPRWKLSREKKKKN